MELYIAQQPAAIMAARTSASSTAVYRSVVAIEAWPSSTCTAWLTLALFFVEVHEPASDVDQFH